MSWTAKPTWSAEQWRDYRRSKGIPPKADMPTDLSRFEPQGKELALMMACPGLDWPSDLLKYAAVEDVAFRPRDSAVNNMCHLNGCAVPHYNRVSAVRSREGVHKVFWFCSVGHMNEWTSQRRSRLTAG
jgi:hypothetical protein